MAKLNDRLPAGLACAFNRVLATQSTPLRDSLRPFAGKTVECVLEKPALSLRFEITVEGHLKVWREANQDLPLAQVEPHISPLPDVLVRLAELPRPPFSTTTLLSSVHIAGNAELAESLGFLLKNLSLQPGDWLHPYLGDILTHRVEVGVRKFSAFIRDRFVRSSA